MATTAPKLGGTGTVTLDEAVFAAEIKLLVRVPMDCWRQWIRHRMANVNEYSTRYSVAIDSAQSTPADAWRARPGPVRRKTRGRSKTARHEFIRMVQGHASR